MSYAQVGHRRGDIGVAILVAGLHALAIGLLWTWTWVAAVPRAADSLVLIEIREPPVEKAPARAKGRAATEPARKAASARPAAASIRPRVKEQEPVTATPLAEASPPANSAGATGTGASAGQGAGGGGNGSGTGGGGSRPRWISGTIRDGDYPRSASRAKAGGTVIVHFEVRTDGRVSNCRVATSSGNADLDRTTCQLVEQRFRYAPATDATGRTISDVAGWKQVWWLEPRR